VRLTYSNYNKIRKSFKIRGREKEHLVHLEALVKTGEIQTKLMRLYDLGKSFDDDDFISLLFYQGIITIDHNEFDGNIFKMPNYVIKQLYFHCFHQIIWERSQLDGLPIPPPTAKSAPNLFSLY
ncbi:MAG: hypothetical protein AAF599_18740, partial [Bacteroidota bacterium]